MNYNELYKAVIRSIYAKYNPEKLSELNSIFYKYQGREKELLEKVSKKYAVPQSELQTYADDYRQAFVVPKSRLPIFIAVLVLFVLVGAWFIIRRHNMQKEAAEQAIALSDTAKIDSAIKQNNDEKSVEKKGIIIKEFTEKELGRVAIDGCGCGYVNKKKALKPANLLLTRTWEEKPVAYMHIDGEIMEFIYQQEGVEKGHAVSIYKSGDYFLIETISESINDGEEEFAMQKGELRIRNLQKGTEKTIEVHGTCGC